ncbi:MAG: Holliday junction branch migration DNA helicase RuvB, partial [Gammaproteobacteria bacterium]|nr:Holliday junction branch migration DNA helicase RuvB [Gammaproteobacteria bacterium]
MEEKRLIDAVVETNESAQERALRPKLLADYVGQPQVSEQMDIFITAARSRAEALD